MHFSCISSIKTELKYCIVGSKNFAEGDLLIFGFYTKWIDVEIINQNSHILVKAWFMWEFMNTLDHTRIEGRGLIFKQIISLCTILNHSKMEEFNGISIAN